jgi:hypothetical protein
MKLEFSRQIIKKYSNTKFHENPSSGVQLFHADRRTDERMVVTKLIVAFRNFVNAPNNIHSFCDISHLQTIHFSYNSTDIIT